MANRPSSSLIVHEYRQLLRKANVFDRDKIEPLLEQFLEQYPHYAPALRLRGLLLNYELSCEADRDTSCSPEDPRARQMRESYEAALKADPDYTLVLIDLGDYWSLQADYAKALEYYDHALRLLRSGHFSDDRDEELMAAYIGKIEALIKIGDITSAQVCQEQAISDCVEKEYFRNLEIAP